jgi:hypothetical protein
MNVHQTAPDLGYIFHPHGSHFGDAPLEVILRARPTGHHFDPEKIRLEVGAPRGVQMLDIHHLWRQGQEYFLCPGRIFITDRYQKCLEVFTFGGHLTIRPEADTTHCQFDSPAPILELTGTHTVPTLLANEVEILLAQRRAARNLRVVGEFDGLLVALEPLTFYASCLQAIQPRFAHYRHGGDPVIQHFKHLLHLEITRLHDAGLWPAEVAALEELI